MFQIKYRSEIQFVVFYLVFCKSHSFFFVKDSLLVDWKWKVVVVFSLGWDGEPGENTTTKQNSPPFRFRFRSCLRFGIYKMPNKTRQKLYFATILDLEHQQTLLITRWVAHFWKHPRRTRKGPQCSKYRNCPLRNLEQRLLYSLDYPVFCKAGAF